MLYTHTQSDVEPLSIYSLYSCSDNPKAVIFLPKLVEKGSKEIIF